MRRRVALLAGGPRPPGPPPCANARAASRPPRGSGPGPGGGECPHSRPARSRAYRRSAKRYLARCFPCPAPLWVAALRSPFRHFACCRRAALCLPGSPAAGGAPRPRCRGRRPPSAASLWSRRPGRSLSPRLARSGRVRRSAAPWPLAGPVCLRPRLRCAAGFLRAPLLRCALGLVQRVAPPGPPLVAPFGASGPGPPRPGARRLRRRLLGFAPGLFFARVLRPLRFPPAGVLPLRPPAPPPPAGWLRGARGLRPWGPRPPLLRSSPGVSPSLLPVFPALPPLWYSASGTRATIAQPCPPARVKTSGAPPLRAACCRAPAFCVYLENRITTSKGAKP